MVNRKAAKGPNATSVSNPSSTDRKGGFMANAGGNDDERISYQKVVWLLLSSKPMAYIPALARKVGGVKSCVMLSQLLFWSGDETVIKRGGWVYKSVPEFEKETGLVGSEQRTARRILGGLGVVISELRGVPPVWWYHVDFQALCRLLNVSINFEDTQLLRNLIIEKGKNQKSRKSKINSGVSSKLIFENPQNFNRNHRLPPETTPETTPDTSSSYPLPEHEEEEVSVEERISDALTSIGLFATLVPEVMKSGWKVDEILSLVKKVQDDPTAESKGAVFMYRLRQGQKPKTDNPDDPTRFINGEYSEFINH